jgi:putative ABC transport system substrate-binding protein
LEVQSLKLENPPYDFDAAFRSFAKDSSQMLLVLSSQYFTLSRSHIAELAIQQRLPTMFIFKVYVQAGGLISYGVDPVANFRQVGFYVAKILNGAKPADLPLSRPQNSSWSSTSRPPRQSASTYRRRFSSAPTR